MNRNTRTLLSGMLLACIIFLLAWKKTNDETIERQKILVSIGDVLEHHHYLSPIINDDFSKAIWMEYINSLDVKKNILLQADLDSLKKYEYYLDNEIHGEPLRFFPQVIGIYAKRCAEVSILYQQILSQPFKFGKNDLIDLDQKPDHFPGSDVEKLNRWKDNLRYSTLQKLIELQEQRSLSKAGDSIHSKTDAQLEQEARQLTLKHFDRTLKRYRSITEDKLFGMYLNVITRYTDPHSDYLAPIEKKYLDEKMGKRFFGIGIQLSEENGSIKMMSFSPGSPSAKSGAFAISDQLTQVGQGASGPMTDVTGMELEEIVKLIRGDQGTIVRIGYKRAGGINKIIPLVRTEIKQEETLARSAVIEEKGKRIGYIYLPIFYDDVTDANGAHCAADVASEINRLKAAHVDGMIMDLRFNGGGSLREVIKMAGLFIGTGPVVQTRNGTGEVEVLLSHNEEPLYRGPLTVLVNEFSASASEIFAGAIQDYRRGIVVGIPTFGKGTVQTTAPLGDESLGVLKLTISKFYRAEGSSTQQMGVIPDIVLPGGRAEKFHEGDMPHALQWDRVERATYNQYSTDVDSVTDIAKIRIAKNSSFVTLQKNNSWLEDHPDNKGKMTVTQYKALLSARRKLARQNEDIQKPGPAGFMSVIPSEVSEQGQMESYQQWLKKIAADLYIKEVMRVTLDMVK